MLIEILLAILAGFLAGTITGLIPGIHINLVGVLLISLSASLLIKIPPLYIALFIVSMAITHTFVDFIPSVFLGCPDADTVLSILPGHSLLKKGEGYEAVFLTAYGGLAAIFILLLIAYPSIMLIPKIYSLIKKVIPYLLIIISLLLIVMEKKKITALFVLLLTGVLGLSVLNLPSLNQPLLPLLTGLFGSSALLISIKTKVKIPKQKITKTKVKILRPILGAVIASPFCSFLPGLGSGQAAIIGNRIALIKDKKQFLILLGATNTLVMGFSFISLYIISKTRTGAAVAIQQILGDISPHLLIIFLITVLISGSISFLWTLRLTKIFSKLIEKVNYALISILTLFILSIVVLIISGFLGFVVFIISSLAGVYFISLGVRRTNMMGSLLIPTILFYLFYI